MSQQKNDCAGVLLGTASEANGSSTKGWVVGHFMPDGLGRQSGLEVKLWHYNRDLDYPPKEFDGTEFIVVYGGTLRIEAVLPDGSAPAPSKKALVIVLSA